MRSSARLWWESPFQYANKDIDGNADVLASDNRYAIRLAKNSADVRSALRLRKDVFYREIGRTKETTSELEWDEFDFRSKHLLAIEKATGETIGTYRINSVDATSEMAALYSAAEFEIENLPSEIVLNGVELGRACISECHRGSKALFLLWKGLGKYLVASQKRYVFGCCSIFTKDQGVGIAAYHELVSRGAMHPTLKVVPKKGTIDVHGEASTGVELPHLFEMYLRLGAKVCGPPMYDAEFCSVDFFVLFDLEHMSDRYRRIFLQ
jgi:putative hemolysin